MRQIVLTAHDQELSCTMRGAVPHRRRRGTVARTSALGAGGPEAVASRGSDGSAGAWWFQGTRSVVHRLCGAQDLAMNAPAQRHSRRVFCIGRRCRVIVVSCSVARPAAGEQQVNFECGDSRACRVKAGPRAGGLRSLLAERRLREWPLFDTPTELRLGLLNELRWSLGMVRRVSCAVRPRGV